jgi:hypothetical protein
MARLAILSAMALNSCSGVSDRSYGLESGDVTYDTLTAATAACQAKGGELRLRGASEGRDLSNYECVIGKAR